MENCAYLRKNPGYAPGLPKTRQKEISSQGTIIEVGCNFVLMRHFQRQLFKRFLLCKCVVVYACGQIDFADFESVDTLR